MKQAVLQTILAYIVLSLRKVWGVEESVSRQERERDVSHVSLCLTHRVHRIRSHDVHPLLLTQTRTDTQQLAQNVHSNSTSRHTVAHITHFWEQPISLPFSSRYPAESISLKTPSLGSAWQCLENRTLPYTLFPPFTCIGRFSKRGKTCLKWAMTPFPLPVDKYAFWGFFLSGVTLDVSCHERVGKQG